MRRRHAPVAAGAARPTIPDGDNDTDLQQQQQASNENENNNSIDSTDVHAHAVDGNGADHIQPETDPSSLSSKHHRQHHHHRSHGHDGDQDHEDDDDDDDDDDDNDDNDDKEDAEHGHTTAGHNNNNGNSNYAGRAANAHHLLRGGGGGGSDDADSDEEELLNAEDILDDEFIIDSVTAATSYEENSNVWKRNNLIKSLSNHTTLSRLIWYISRPAVLPDNADLDYDEIDDDLLWPKKACEVLCVLVKKDYFYDKLFEPFVSLPPQQQESYNGGEDHDPISETNQPPAADAEQKLTTHIDEIFAILDLPRDFKTIRAPGTSTDCGIDNNCGGEDDNAEGGAISKEFHIAGSYFVAILSAMMKPDFFNYHNQSHKLMSYVHKLGRPFVSKFVSLIGVIEGIDTLLMHMLMWENEPAISPDAQAETDHRAQSIVSENLRWWLDAPINFFELLLERIDCVEGSTVACSMITTIITANQPKSMDNANDQNAFSSEGPTMGDYDEDDADDDDDDEDGDDDNSSNETESGQRNRKIALAKEIMSTKGLSWFQQLIDKVLTKRLRQYDDAVSPLIACEIISCLNQVLASSGIGTGAFADSINDQSNVVSLILSRLTVLTDFLKNPPTMLSVRTGWGTANPPVGSVRLKILDLFLTAFEQAFPFSVFPRNTAISTFGMDSNSPAVYESMDSALKPESSERKEQNSRKVFVKHADAPEDPATSTVQSRLQQLLLKSEVLPVVMDLFFQFEFNNILHSYVTDIVKIVLMGDNYELVVQLLHECKLFERVLDAERDNRKHEEETGTRFGYMGFITQIENTMAAELGDVLEELTNQTGLNHRLGEWTQFVQNDLKKRNFIEGMYKCGEIELPKDFAW